MSDFRVPCPKCDGLGHIKGKPCANCEGRGSVSAEKPKKPAEPVTEE